jgi:hypothetical protein
VLNPGRRDCVLASHVSFSPVKYLLVLAVLILTGFLLLGCAGARSTIAVETVEPSPNEVPDEAPIDEAAASELDGTNSTQGSATDACRSDDATDEQGTKPDCVEIAAQDEALLDRTQRSVHGALNSTTRMFDGLFGEVPLYEGEYVSRGRAIIGPTWDQRDGFDIRFRLRARYALPALENRARLVLGRGDTDDIIDGSANDAVESLPGSFDDTVDDDWLIGLGYSRTGNRARGFDIGAGVRLTTPPEPYVHLTYRWYKTWAENLLFRTRARTFWQENRGTGITLDTDLDYVINPILLLRWANNFSAEDRIEGLGWRTDIIAYQDLTNNRALAYGVFAQTETDAEVPLKNVGFDIRYRQRMAREWFYIEVSAGISWPRDFLIEQRKSNLGAGISFEMRFGRW